MPRIELSFQDTFPAGPTGPLRARQAENHRSVRNTCHGAGLDRRRPDLIKGLHPKQFPKALDLLIEERGKRLRRAVPPRKARAPGGEHHINLRVGNPGGHLGAHGVAVVGAEASRGQRMPRLQERTLEVGVPERSSLIVRVSESVSTATRRGKNSVAMVPFLWVCIACGTVACSGPRPKEYSPWGGIMSAAQDQAATADTSGILGGSRLTPPTFSSPAEERAHLKVRLSAAFRLFAFYGFDEGPQGTSPPGIRSALIISG